MLEVVKMKDLRSNINFDSLRLHFLTVLFIEIKLEVDTCHELVQISFNLGDGGRLFIGL